MITAAYGATFLSWRVFRRQIRAGRLTDARRACEFYVLFVSDHLPLVIDINYDRA
jgi:hypothetical protein